MALKVASLPLKLVCQPFAFGLGPSESDPVLIGRRLRRLTDPRLARPMKIDHVAQLFPHLVAGFLRTRRPVIFYGRRTASGQRAQ
ncbi:hypothetical protein Xaut_1666 [Xanthobacter versatilis]|uniref:Uncharacterized protein n=1 Tax=Xanthobacter autotrophicus (strain ATCC BAA-1158 / Py2) TaxID=78245 RepID=A7IFW8_XANP2|nr:hypothetical protein Xaut_1666 [Xanthobacter autotrophicus Py2]